MLIDACTSAGFLIRIIVKVFKYIRFILPILLVVLITYDLFKTFVGNLDEKARKDAFNTAIKRLIYAVIIFFIPTIITVVFRRIESISAQDNKTSTTSTSWIRCWLSEYNK